MTALIMNPNDELLFTDLQKDIIAKHMFPVTLIPPKTKEGFLLTIVDKYCCIKETIDYYLHIIKRRKYIYQ